MSGRVLGALLLLSTAIVPSQLLAANVDAQSKIGSVTVFPRGAQVTRITEVDIKAGEHTVILKDLPVGAIADSITVEGAADGDLEIGSVDVKRIYIPRDGDYIKSEEDRKKLEDELEALNDKLSTVEGLLKSVKFQQNYIRELSKLPGRSPRYGKDGVVAEPDWNGLFDLIGSKMDNLGKKQLELNVQKRQINKDIKDVQKKLSAKPPRQERKTQVKVLVSAEKDLKASFKVRYQVYNASWRPIYDARLSTKDGPDKAKLDITRRASITQNTGEKWTDIALSLSTTKPNRSTKAPTLRSLLIDERPPVEKKGRGRPGGIGGVMNMYSGDSGPAEMQAARPMPAQEMRAKRKIRRREAVVRQSAFQAVFEIPGQVSIETTNEAKKLTISKFTIKPKLKAIAVPKLQKVAFLSTNFTLPKDVQLMTGRVNLHRDGVFIGKGYFPDLASGAEYDLGFGADDAIQVKYAEVDRSKGETGIISSSKTDARKFRITVKNLHGWTMPLTIMDRIPYSENEKITVKMLPETDKPSRTNVDEKRGLLAWDFDLGKGAEKKINLSYKIGWPKEMRIMYRQK